MKGYVYFLINVSMPGLVKIGHTTQSLDARLKQLNSTGVPSPFELRACFFVGNSAQTEAKIHNLLAKRRNSSQREFFVGSLSEILQECFAELSNAINEESKPHLSSTPNGLDLEDKDISLLILLTGYYKNSGYSSYDIYKSCEESELRTEARLATLKTLKLVSETKASRHGYTKVFWKITSTGVKFLFDYGHIIEDT